MAISRRSFTSSLAASAVASLPATVGAQTAGTFRHGVASGDPLLNRVILWTRLTPAVDEAVIPVEWVISEDPSLSRVYQTGLTYTNVAFDYTVKVDVGRLQPGTTYYYQFTVRGAKSPVGRTKTLPIGAVSRLRLAVTSCSNHPFGFFNSYRNIAARRDLDCVLHLGDYIYEYAAGTYGDGSAIGRVPLPAGEIVTLADYRTRYAQYRTDPDLQEVHRQHPFIVVWDDHESANDAWQGGAENHNGATQGDWSARRATAQQAWLEWLPVRENVYEGGQIYRTFRFGDLLDLVMLDTRLAGRNEPVTPANLSGQADPRRTLLGFEQEAWLYNQLASSQARNTRWRVLGQQVMMGQLVGADGPLNTDQWDGYLGNRNRLLQSLTANSVDNLVVLTGDIHSSWANEIAVNPFAAATARPQAVEFVTPAVTSPGIADLAQATGFAAQITATHPHVKYVDLFRRGYLLLDVDRDRTQGEWYHVRTIRERSADEEFARSFRAASGENRLVTVGSASAAPTGAPPLAP